MHVWLFDIDGTLIDTDGAGRRAFEVAIAGEFGPEGLVDIEQGLVIEQRIAVIAQETMGEILNLHGPAKPPCLGEGLF